VSDEPPYPVFTAMHGTDSWDAQLVAPSLESFWKCVVLFREIARNRANPVQLEMNPPADEEINAFLNGLHRLCDGNETAISFWVVQAEIGMESES